MDLLIILYFESIITTMNKTIFVVFCLLFTSSCFADGLNDRLFRIQAKWEQVHYTYPEEQRAAAFSPLLKVATALAHEYPMRAEPLILQASIMLTTAANEGPFTALSSVEKARDLLVKAIAIDPTAKEGSAYVTLGVLYYKVPSWPIAFGDDAKAGKLLQMALRISPNAVDSNYFYGDFLLTQGRVAEAAEYFSRAINAPAPHGISLGNTRLRQKAKQALEEIGRSTSVSSGT